MIFKIMKYKVILNQDHPNKSVIQDQIMILKITIDHYSAGVQPNTPADPCAGRCVSGWWTNGTPWQSRLLPISGVSRIYQRTFAQEYVYLVGGRMELHVDPAHSILEELHVVFVYQRRDYHHHLSSDLFQRFSKISKIYLS